MTNSETMIEHRLDAEGVDPLMLAGVNDRNLQEVGRLFGVRTVLRGDHLILSGDLEGVERSVPVLQHMIELARLRAPFDVADIARFADGIDELGDEGVIHPTEEVRIALPGSRRVIVPKSDGQRTYIDSILEHDIVIGIGPAGTGKTYLAVACAVEALMQDRVKRVLLVRPAVEAGEKLGFLPGDLAQKIDPYLRPLYDALYEMLGFEKVGRLIEKNVIEVAPLAYMRGRTLNGSFIILDESQNTTVAQMKMFLTRIGFGSRAVITGDVTQIDLPKGTRSGLVHVLKVLDGMKDIGFTHFNSRDVVRHSLVQRIVEAYDRYDQDNTIKSFGQQDALHRHERDHRAD